MVRGHVSFESNGVGDFVIVKSDGIPVYNFAVVMDDHMMGITTLFVQRNIYLIHLVKWLFMKLLGWEVLSLVIFP